MAMLASLLQKFQEQVSNSRQLFGILTLVITGAISLLLTGLTVATTILGLILFTPLIIVSSPIWVPVCAILLVVTAGFLCMYRFGLAVVAMFSWIFRYVRDSTLPAQTGFTPQRGHAKDSGWYLRSKAIDATPGA